TAKLPTGTYPTPARVNRYPLDDKEVVPVPNSGKNGSNANQKPTAPSVPAEGGRILDVERLRGYAILAVMCMHLDLPIHLIGHLLRRFGLEPMQTPCWLGVQLFFVISGFVVLRSFYSGGRSLPQFYLRRIFRL